MVGSEHIVTYRASMVLQLCALARGDCLFMIVDQP